LDYPFKVAYVVTSNGADIYTDMALVSMLSVQISNPDLQIVAVCDEQSAIAIKASKHRLLDVCDEFISVKTPDGEPTFRNRWIKTQLCNFVPGPCLYLDVDTLVRGTLDELPSIVTDFGAVANHNGLTPQEQLWDEDAKEMSKMNWLPELAFFPNGGVFFYHSTEATFRFFRLWHELWQKSFEKLGRGRDQPAFYTALSGASLHLTEIPANYNWQVVYNPKNWLQACILHFYPDPAYELISFGQVLKLARKMPIKKLRIYVRRCIEKPSESIYSDFVSQWFKERRSCGLEDEPGADLWLMGYKKRAVRYWLGKIKQNIERWIIDFKHANSDKL
jgi:hypothetical protein